MLITILRHNPDNAAPPGCARPFVCMRLRVREAHGRKKGGGNDSYKKIALEETFFAVLCMPLRFLMDDGRMRCPRYYLYQEHPCTQEILHYRGTGGCPRSGGFSPALFTPCRDIYRTKKNSIHCNAPECCRKYLPEDSPFT